MGLCLPAQGTPHLSCQPRLRPPAARPELPLPGTPWSPSSTLISTLEPPPPDRKSVV